MDHTNSSTHTPTSANATVASPLLFVIRTIRSSKMDYVDLVKFSSSGICFSCLSSDRKMYYSDRIKKCFNMIADIDIPEGVVVKVCWECMAYIDNVFRFKGTVERSYQILTDYCTKNKSFDAFVRPKDIMACSYPRLQCMSCEPVAFHPQQDWSVKKDIKVEQDVSSDFSLDSAPFDESTIKEVPPETTSEGYLGSSEPTFKEYEVPLVSVEGSQGETSNISTNMGDSKTDEAKKSRDAIKLSSYEDRGKEFLQGFRLFKEMRTQADKKRFKCELCPYKTKYSGSLKMHMRTHTGEKPFSCNVCSYKCKARAVLRQHMQMHAGDYSLSCKLCPYKCIQKTSLKIHMLTHTGEKPFSCEFCSYKSLWRTNLNKHRRTHTGEKPYICEICSTGFSLNNSLQIHLRTHTGEKPFSCEICLLRLSSKTGLRSHMKTHTDEKRFGCELCSYRSRRRNGLKEHMRTHMNPKGIKGSLN